MIRGLPGYRTMAKYITMKMFLAGFAAGPGIQQGFAISRAGIIAATVKI
jgi:hypothetical protein